MAASTSVRPSRRHAGRLPLPAGGAPGHLPGAAAGGARVRSPLGRQQRRRQPAPAEHRVGLRRSSAARPGFDVSQSLIDYSSTSTYGRAFWVGLLNTLLVAVLGIVAATVLGFVIGIARLSSNWLVAQLAAAYVEIVRNVPLLLQLFFWYFAVLQEPAGAAPELRLARRRLLQRARAVSAGAGAAAGLRGGRHRPRCSASW